VGRTGVTVSKVEDSVLTVEEAAEVLRIGRGTAYALARRFRDTGGREGLPVIVLGRSLRVPRAGLERLLNGDALLSVAVADPANGASIGRRR
jgi:excisionase family DNA binding protein